jgi:hypothetical protein
LSAVAEATVEVSSIQNRATSIENPAFGFVALKARSHLTMVRFPTFHRPEHEKAHTHLTISLKTSSMLNVYWLKLSG